MTDLRRASLVVIAKAPAPGRVKTRLCPPLSGAEAAAVAEAALIDTLDAACASSAGRVVVALEGSPGPWLPPGIEVIPQRGNGLAERIAAALADVGGPALVIGMDTPQVTPARLDEALELLYFPGNDAVLGHALDGGFWALGLKRPDEGALRGVPMSDPRTGTHQYRRLLALGYAVALLPPMRDIDDFADLLAVARQAPNSATRRALDAVTVAAG